MELNKPLYDQQPSNEFKAPGATLVITKTKIIIRRHGFLSLLNHGSKGDKEIFIKNITAIQIKEPGFTNGFIQFSLSGEKGSKGGVFEAAKDENSIMIAGMDQYRSFLKAKELIEKYINEANQPVQVTTSLPAPESELDQIEKLHSMKERGILTEEEFTHQKRKILGLA
jgi:hypothetical protein